METSGRQETEARDVRRGLTGPERDVAQVLYNFAKTARSFGFYSRDNEAITQFLAELEEGFTHILDENGALRLVVGADRFVWKGTPVYVNGDREKGLPFRLFRDGIRGFVFKPGLDHRELLQLLDVLSRRQSTGRNAEEEDVVTLLWKLSLNNVSYEAVEGFTHEIHGDASKDGEVEGGGEALPRMMERISGQRETLDRGQAARSFVDRGNDDLLAEVAEGEDLGATGSQLYGGSRHYPLPRTDGPVAVSFEEITEDELAGLRAELDEETRTGVPKLLDYCFELCQVEAGFFEPDDFAPMVGAMRRYLLRQRDLEVYDEMVRYLRQVVEGGEYPTYLTRRASEMLADCAKGDSVAALVASVVGNATDEELAWDTLQTLLPDLDPANLFDLLAHGMSERLAAILAATIIRRTGSNTLMFEEGLRIDGSEPDVPRALASLRCLATLRTPEAIDLIAGAMVWPDVLVRRAAVRILGRLPLTPLAIDALGGGLDDDDETVWREALTAMDRQREPATAPALLDWIGRNAFTRLDEEERHDIVRIAAEIDPDVGTLWFSDKIQMSLLAKMGGLVGTPEVISWNRLAAVGLSHCATDAAIDKLRAIRTKGDDDFRQHVGPLVAAARRRKAQR